MCKYYIISKYILCVFVTFVIHDFVWRTKRLTTYISTSLKKILQRKCIIKNNSIWFKLLETIYLWILLSIYLLIHLKCADKNKIQKDIFHMDNVYYLNFKFVWIIFFWKNFCVRKISEYILKNEKTLFYWICNSSYT